MTPDEYWAAIERIPLYRQKLAPSGDAYICRDATNQPVRVIRPELLTAPERVAAVAHYRLFYGPTRH